MFLHWLDKMYLFVCLCCVAHRFSYLCCPIMCLYVLSSVLCYPLWFLHKNDVRFVFTSSCVYDSSCLICVCLRIVVSNTHCVAFLFCSMNCSIFDYHFGILLHLFPNINKYQKFRNIKTFYNTNIGHTYLSAMC
jgi:hypothetical protein